MARREEGKRRYRRIVERVEFLDRREFPPQAATRCQLIAIVERVQPDDIGLGRRPLPYESRFAIQDRSTAGRMRRIHPVAEHDKACGAR